MPIRILHLEDDPADAELAAATLTADGLDVEVTRVDTAADFEAALRAGLGDIILADYALPNYDGLAALELAQQLAPDVPFVFLTGAMGEEMAVESLKRGAVDYIYKNRLRRLPSAVRRALAEAQVRADHREAQREAHAEHEWLRVTLASIGDAVVATDTEGRVTFMNAVAEALTGWPQAVAAGRPITEVFHIVNEYDGTTVPSPVLRVIETGGPVDLANHTLLVTRQGQRVPIDDSAAPILDRHGALIGVVLVFRDVTTRRHTEATLAARARQQAAVAALGQRALASHNALALMDEVVARVADTLGVEMVKVLELLPDRDVLLIRAGRGWHDGVVGHTLVDAGPNSQAGYTLQANTPILVTDLRTETRFAGMPVLHQHGVVSGMTVVIPGPQRPFGVLGAHTRQTRAFTEDDANFLQAAANVLAEAIARQHVEDSLRGLTLRLDRALAEAELLNAIATATSGEADLERLLTNALEHLSRAVAFTGGSIALLEGPHLVVRAAHGPFASIALGQRLPRDHGAAWHVVEKGEPFLSNDLEASRLSPATPIKSFMAVPLTWREAVIGLLEVDSTRPHAFDDSDLMLLQRAATLLCGSVALARQYSAEQAARAEAEAARRRLAFLAEASTLLSGTLGWDDTLQTVARLAVPDLADYASLYLRGDDGRLEAVTHAHADASRTEALPVLERLYAPSADDPASLVGHVVKTGQSLLLPQLPPDALERLPPGSPERRQVENLGSVSGLIVPLVARGRTLGALLLAYAGSGRRYSAEDMALAEDLGRRAALAVDNAQLFAEARGLNAELEQRVEQRTAELHAAAERLRRSERLLSEAQQIAELGSWQWDVAANHLTWSDELYRIYGRDRATFPGTYEAFMACVHPDDRDRVHAILTRARQDHQPFVFDHRIVRPDGSVRHLHARGEVAVDGDRRPRGLTGIALDITDRKQIEDELRQSREELRRLSEHLQAAREEERKRIAREIHDELGGALTSLKMDLSRLSKNAGSLGPEGVRERTQGMTRLVEETIKTVRRIATDLRPGVLDDLGLLAAIEWQLHDFQARSGIECRLDSQFEELDLGPDGATAVFRVFQETLTNVARHAQATRVDVRLENHGDYLVLHVQDNGRGITERDMAGTHSLGLVGMRERVRLLAGELSIRGAPGQGTTVQVKVPLNGKGKTAQPADPAARAV